MKDKLIYIVTFITVIIGYSCWEYVQLILSHYYSAQEAEKIACKFFFVCIEAGFAGYAYSVMKAQTDKETLFFRFTRMVFYTTLATLCDRLYGDPYSVSPYEYVFLVVNVIALFIDGAKIRTVGDKIRQFRKNIR